MMRSRMLPDFIISSAQQSAVSYMNCSWECRHQMFGKAGRQIFIKQQLHAAG